MGCLKLNIENPTTLKVLNGGKSTNFKSRERVYLYGYQGSEKDDEIKGNGNSYTTEFRMLDPRLGRWLSIDPKPEAGVSPYSSMDNNPILFNDKLGLYTKRRAERMEKKAQDKGYTTFGVKQTEGGGKFDYGFNKIDENSGEYSGQYKGKIKDIGSSSSGGGANFFGIDYDAIAKNKGNSSNDGKVSVWNKDYQESCKSNKAMQASAKHWNAVENGLLTYAGVSLAAPFVIFGAVEAAPVLLKSANFLIKTGRAQSFLGEFTSQTTSQLTENGSIDIGDYDLLNLGTSLLVTNSNKITNKVVEFTQGINGTFISYDLNNGWGGYAFENHSKSWLTGSLINGITSTYGSSMLGGSVIEDLLINNISGVAQGTLNK